jgi:hypothetical protein
MHLHLTNQDQGSAYTHPITLVFGHPDRTHLSKALATRAVPLSLHTSYMTFAAGPKPYRIRNETFPIKW